LERKLPVALPYVIEEKVESPDYLAFWLLQRKHGWRTISYQKENGKWYFLRKGRECKFQ